MVQRKATQAEKKVVVLQSNYLPWKGYFDLIRKADLLIFYDDTQYTKNDWRNRNRIKTPRGPQWLTVPCGPRIHRLIQDVAPSHDRWQRSHWDSIRQNYRLAPYFNQYKSFFEEFFLGKTWKNLSELNQFLIQSIALDFLGIHTPMLRSTDFAIHGAQEERLISLLQKVGTTTYLSGPTGKDFLRAEPFAEAGIRLEWMDYSGYRPYDQLYPPFVHEVSIIDLLFQKGPMAISFLEQEEGRGYRQRKESVSVFTKI